MVRNDIKNSSLLKTKFLIYAFNGRTQIKLTLQRNPTTKEKKRTETTPHSPRLCKVLSTKFNIMAAILPTKRPSCRKNSILAKVRCNAKWGLLLMQEDTFAFA